MVTPAMAARVISAYVFDDPVVIARREIAALRPNVDVLIALTHIGVREDERLAAECPELDAILGGHSHVVLPTPQIVNGVAIAQGGWYGHYLGVIEVSVDKGKKPAVTGRLLSLRD
jgi:2',3'-cyclic-nucleotide 2'-phosphodiesterase (5'-nucleotidase family)